MNVSASNATGMEFSLCAPSLEELSAYGDTTIVPAFWICMSISVAGILVNAFAFYVFFARKLVGKKPRILILHQSLADGMYSFVTLFWWSMWYRKLRVPSNIIGDFICRGLMTIYLSCVFQAISTINLQAIIIERFVSVVMPMKRRGTKSVKFACVFMWLFGLTFASAFIFSEMRGSGLESDCCTLASFQLPDMFWYVYGICVFVIDVIIPVSCMIFCYTVMIVKLRSTSAVSSSESDAKKKKASAILFKTFAAAGVAYIVCVAPSELAAMLVLVGVIKRDDRAGDGFYLTAWDTILWFLLNANMVINPLIYFCFVKPFQKEVINILMCKKTEVLSSVKTTGTLKSTKISTRSSILLTEDDLKTRA